MSESEEEGVRSMPGSAEVRCSSGGERELHPQLVGRVQVVRVPSPRQSCSCSGQSV